MVEAVAEMDDELTHKYLEGEEFTEEELKRGLRLGTLQNRIVPVLTGSALKNKGIQAVLDAVVDYLPSPLDVPPMIGLDPRTGREVLRTVADDEPFSALAFKIAADPFVGKLAFFRVYSGTLKSGSYVLNATKGKKERLGRILQMHANHREEIDDVYAGDIAAAVGLKETFTGDTLSDPEHPVILESMTFPEPVIEVAIEPKTKADQDKLGVALQRLAEEDPTFRVQTNEETGQTLIAGMGELHLDVLVDRMVREFHVAANVGKPQVSYRETIRRAAEGNGRFVRQTGGKGQYGHAVIKLEPNEKGAGYEFIDKIVGGTIPREYIKPVDTGIREALETGIYAGYPVVDVKVTLHDGSFHEVDSSEMAFKIAGSMAVKDAFQQADPVILEPIMKVEVTMPEEFMGDVIGDLNSRRGHIDGDGDPRRGQHRTQVVRAFVPLAEMFGYATDLRSMTQGRASYSMEFAHYAEVPAQHRRTELGRKSKVRRSATHASRSRECHDGQEEVRAHQAARQHRHDRPHRPRQDDADRGHHQVPRPQGRGGVPRLRHHRQRARGARAGHHHRHRPRGVRDGRPPLRPRRLPRPRRLHQEHDHRRRPDGRRHPRRGRHRRPDAPDPRAHPAGPPGRGALHRRLPQQGRHGRRPRAARARRARGPRAAHQVQLPGRRHPRHPRLGAQGPRGAATTRTTRPTPASRSSWTRSTPTSRRPSGPSTSPS